MSNATETPGADEFENRGGTIPQRLLMMNGELLRDRFKENPFPSSSMRVAELAPTDEQAVEVPRCSVCLTAARRGKNLLILVKQLAGTEAANAKSDAKISIGRY